MGKTLFDYCLCGDGVVDAVGRACAHECVTNARPLPCVDSWAANCVAPLFFHHNFFGSVSMSGCLHSAMIPFGNKKSIYPKWNCVRVSPAKCAEGETKYVWYDSNNTLSTVERKCRLIQFKNDVWEMLLGACVCAAVHSIAMFANFTLLCVKSTFCISCFSYSDGYGVLMNGEHNNFWQSLHLSNFSSHCYSFAVAAAAVVMPDAEAVSSTSTL